MRTWIIKAWNDNKSFVLFIALMVVFRSAVADWNEVPTGSMKPTILEGDRILINKLAYDVRVPFTNISLLKLSDPLRGDIVIFESHMADNRLVKRVVGVPGDTVSMQNNSLIINGEAVEYELAGITDSAVERRENLLGIEYVIRTSRRSSRLSNFKSIKVPVGFYLVLGDNRDKSADSRVIGLVPRYEIIGRSRSVIMSFDYDNYYIPRKDRFFHSL